jgi:glycosyltransferase involved in cell wall biosynthesis
MRLVADDGSVLSERVTRFLCVAEVSARKNVDGLLRAWTRATSPEDDAVLILKLTSSDPLRFERLWVTVLSELRRLGLDLESAAPVHVINTVLADADMPRLYATGTHYISLSHGEGWDLPAAEAAAAGLRLIVPDHSAYRAYVDPTVARLVPARTVPVAWDGWLHPDPLFAGLEWWEPDEDAAVSAIREALGGVSKRFIWI